MLGECDRLALKINEMYGEGASSEFITVLQKEQELEIAERAINMQQHILNALDSIRITLLKGG